MTTNNINFSAKNVNALIRHNYISTLLIESTSELNIQYLSELSNEELAEQIMMLREIKRLKL